MCPQSSSPSSPDIAHKDNSTSLPSPEILRHIVDVHCHPTDTWPVSDNYMENDLQITVCAMSTRASDQGLVRELASGHPQRVVPCFGYHPWFTHWISLRPISSKEQHYRELLLNSNDSTTSKKDSEQDLETAFAELLPSLPEPTPISEITSTLRSNLLAFPSALLGEVGLDRASRIPYAYPAHPISLTPFTIPIEHQLAVLEAQISVAVELRRGVSLHSVKAQLATKELIERMAKRYGDAWAAISVDLHSCALSPQMWKDIEKKHPNIFLSLSTAINSRSLNHRALIAACSPSRILVESDFHTIDDCTGLTWSMILTIAEVKGWRVEEAWDYGENDTEANWGVVKRLEENWKLFKAGGHANPSNKSKQRRKNKVPPEEQAAA